MATALDFETMPIADLDAALALIRDAKKKAQDAENAKYAELGRELVETIISEQGVEASEYSERVGVSSSSLPVVIDGRKYTFYVSIKDVTATEERAQAVKDGTVTLKKRAPKKGSTES